MNNTFKRADQTIEITTGTILRAILLVLLVVFLYWIREIVAVVLFSVVVASAIAPAARWFTEHKIPRVLGVLLVYLAALIILGSLFYIIIPTLFDELYNFASQFPAYIQESFAGSQLSEFLPELPVSIPDYLSGALNAMQGPIKNAAGGFLGAASAVFGGALSFVLIIVISFYLAVQERGIENFLRIITPMEHEPYILDLWKRSQGKIGRWLQGQLLLGVLVGILAFLGLTILQVKYALMLAALSAVFELIPLFGPVMAAIPAVAIALIQKPILGLAVLGLYIVIQQFENHLIYPLVVRKTVGVHPLVVILSLLIGGKIAGFFGFILAVPIAAILVELADDVAKKKQIS